MEPRDLVEVKRLHEQCFPVRYDMVSERTHHHAPSFPLWSVIVCSRL